jgi:hypothetical protein
MNAKIKSPINFSVIDKMPSSLPMGGIVADTPIFSVDTQALALFNKPDTNINEAKLTTLALEDRLAFVIDNVLTAEECELIINITEQLGYRPEAPGIQTPPGMRMNESVHWLSDELVLDKVFKRISSLLPAKIDNRSLHPRLSQRMNFYKYNQNDVFNRHIDGAWPGFGFSEDKSQMVKWPHVESMLTMLLYLNGHENGVEGGCTKIYGDIDTIDVKPQTGRALFLDMALA